MIYTVVSADENTVEIWDGATWTAPGKQVSEPATLTFLDMAPHPFNPGDQVEVVIRMFAKFYPPTEPGD